ncbi:MAG: PPOX class F420-dependent oxidoreductase [Nocardioidaceae bacterium]
MSTAARLLDLAAGRNLGVLTTLKRDGRPQLSAVNYTLEASDPAAPVVRVSVTDDRAKVRNARRDPRVSLFVSSDDGWSYAVLEGDAELSPVATRTDDATVEALVDLYRAARGAEHPDWDDYRRAMVADKRLVLTLHVTHVYGAAPGS